MLISPNDGRAATRASVWRTVRIGGRANPLSPFSTGRGSGEAGGEGRPRVRLLPPHTLVVPPLTLPSPRRERGEGEMRRCFLRALRQKSRRSSAATMWSNTPSILS